MKPFAIAMSAAAVLSFFAIPEIHAKERTMNGHILEKAELLGLYRRK